MVYTVRQRVRRSERLLRAMRFVLSISLAAATLMASIEPAAAQSSPFVIRRDRAATVAAEIEDGARAALRQLLPEAGDLTLDHRETVKLADGTALVRFVQTHRGLPVIARGATVSLAPDGTRRAIAKTTARFPEVHVPSVGRQSAASTARAAAGVAFAPDGAVLAWLPGPLGTRLVWVFHRRLAAGAPLAPVVVVDARSGELLLAFDATRRDREAIVHTENPVSTPTPETVVLEDLQPGAMNLTSEWITVKNCVDRKTVVRGFGFDLHVCDLEQLAVADADGNFPYEYENDFLPEDEHAEVAMFFHASRAYSFFKSLGMPDLASNPLPCVVNFRMAEGLWTGNVDPLTVGDPDVALEPLDNAFFSPATPFFGRFWKLEEDALWFGQGRQRDFAYDGDVVYHEFGHAMVGRTADLVPYWLLDDQGASPAPGAMNEGIADYFSSAITGDPMVGEYVGQAFGMGSIRNLDNTDRCPQNLSGEVHADSTLFSGALWHVRASLPESDRDELDRAIMAALLAAPSGELAYEELGDLVLQAVAASALGPAGADMMRSALEARGILPPCERTLEWEGRPIAGKSISLFFTLVVPGKAAVGVPESEPFAPGQWQLHVPLKPETEEVELRWRDVPNTMQGLSFDGELTPYEPAVIARFADDPIRFDYGPGVQTNAEEPVEATRGSNRYRVTVPAPAGATDGYFMVVNAGDEDGLLTDLVVETHVAPPQTGGTGFGGAGNGGAGASGSGAAGATGDEAEPESPDLVLTGGGCACRTDGSRRHGGALAAYVALVAGLLRRRRRH